MVLQPIVLPVSVDQLNVLLLVRIATNLQVLVELYHIVVKKMVLQPTMQTVSVDLQNVLLIQVIFAMNQSIHVIKYHAVIH